MSEEEAECLNAQFIEANALHESDAFVQTLSNAGQNIISSKNWSIQF